MNTLNESIFPDLKIYIQSLVSGFDQIPHERKSLLKSLTKFVEEKNKAKEPAQLIFICTHNSRRSHLSQIWAQTAATYYGIEGVKTFSGGTEATAFNPRAVNAMKKAGFKIDKKGDEANPHYSVRFSDTGTVEAFSKKYDEFPNPSENFCAVMTCGHADENCPFIPGASARIPLTYNDPKDYDGTPLEEAKYDEGCKQIGTEIFYAFSLVGRIHE